ncbi:MAG TPA: glycosyltransferase family 9 protein [Chthoniobacterales bacterium]|nr:glycosyltransferase family 9 protein [Chthoniobacterales bacterium]
MDADRIFERRLRELKTPYLRASAVCLSDSCSFAVGFGEVRMKSILIVQLKRLGDLILTTPALAALRREHPESQVTLLIDHYSRDLAPALQHIDEVLVYEQKRSFPIWFQLLRRDFDLCIDCTGTDRSALISFLSKASHRVISRSVARHRLRSWVYTELVDVSVRNCHTIDLYLSLVGSGQDTPKPGLELSLPAATVSSAQKVKTKLGVAGPFFVVHPGTARREKYWLPERWAEVVRYLQDRLQLPAVITGGADAEESRHIDAIKNFLGPKSSVANVAGRLDFLLTAALIREAAFFIGVDTAAAHVASAFERPQVVLFGPTNPYHWHPTHVRSRVVRAGFGPDYEPRNPRENGEPMTALSTGTVIDAIESVLGEGAAAR